MSRELEDPKDTEHSQGNKGSTDILILREAKSYVVRKNSNNIYDAHD